MKLQKVYDSYEMQHKANSQVLARLVQEMMRANSFQAFQKSERVANLLSESVSLAGTEMLSEKTKSELSVGHTPDRREIDLHLD